LRGITKGIESDIIKIRERLLNVKIRVLKAITNSLRSPWINMWDECILAIEDLSTEDINLFGDIEMIYEKGNTDAEEYICGGFNDLMFFIGFCESEKSIGQFAKSREVLNDLIVNKLKGNYRFKQINFYDFFKEYGIDQLYSALQTFMSMEDKRTEFWKYHWESHTNDLKGIFSNIEVTLSFTVPVAYKNQFSQHMQVEGDWTAKNLKLYGNIAGKAKRCEKISPMIFSKSELIDLKWNEVTITFITENRIQILARDQKKEVYYSEIGFQNQITKKPIYAWELFRIIAREKEFSYDIDVDQKVRDRARQQIGKISKLLRSLFGIQDNPLPYIQKKGGWIPKFHTIDRSSK